MLRKLAMVSVVLVLFAGGGVWLWWQSTEVERNLNHFNESLAHSDKEFEWMAAHGADERVQRALIARFQQIGDAQPGLADTHELSGIGRSIKAHPPAISDDLLRSVARVVVAGAYPDAGKWFPGYADSPAVAAELLGELQDLSQNTSSRWSEFAGDVESNYAVLEDELDRHKVPEDDARIAAETGVSLRYGFPRCLEKVRRWGDDPRVLAACETHLIFWANHSGYSSADGELGRVLAALTERKSQPSDALLDAMCRFGGSAGVDSLVKTWGPSVLPRLVSRRDAQTDPWLKTQTSLLLARCGGGGAADVAPILQELTRWLPEPTPALPDTSPPPPFLEKADWGQTAQSDIDRSLDSLVAVGPAAVVELKRGLRDKRLPLVQISARALARIDSKALIEEIRGALLQFTQQVDLFGKISNPGAEPSTFSAETYTTEGRVIAEGLTALDEVKDPPQEIEQLLQDAIACPDSNVALKAVGFLGKRLDTAKFVPVLFASLGGRSSFSNGEIDAYVKDLTSRPDVAPPLVKALEAMLEAAGGTPDGLPMIRKVVGLRAIAEVGDASAIAVLERYAKDATSYRDITTEYNSRTMQTTQKASEYRKFADLANAALLDVRGR